MAGERSAIELSPREKQLLQYAAEGFTDTAIANKLGISEATVGTYWGRVRIKLGPHSRTELVAIVLRSEQEAAVDLLRKENEELTKRLSEDAETGKSFYRDLLENAPDAILVIDAEGTVQMTNTAACEMFGYEPAEFEGLELSALVPPRLRDRHTRHREEYVTHPQRRQMGEHLQTPAVKKDGTEFLIRGALSSVESPAGLVVICVVRQVAGSR